MEILSSELVILKKPQLKLLISHKCFPKFKLNEKQTFRRTAQKLHVEMNYSIGCLNTYHLADTSK